MNKKIRTIDDLLETTFNESFPESGLDASELSGTNRKLAFFKARVSAFAPDFATQEHIWVQCLADIDSSLEHESIAIGVHAVRKTTSLSNYYASLVVTGYRDWRIAQGL